MKLVDTPNYTPTDYVRTPDGKIDQSFYVGKDATIEESGLTFHTKIIATRMRYGHLDLLLTPQNGSGERWVEYKNVTLVDAPARGFTVHTDSDKSRWVMTQNFDTLTVK